MPVSRVLVVQIILLFIFGISTSQAQVSLDEYPYYRSRKLEDADLANLSTSSLNLEKGEMILDNRTGLEKKLEMIRGAKNQIIRMSYYIFTNDFSSAEFCNELLKAVKERGNTARILLDYPTNFKNLDFYSMLEKKGEGRIEFRFFNRPTENIIRGAVFMTMQCPDPAKRGEIFRADCSKEKRPLIESLFSKVSKSEALNIHTPESAQFLAGLYSKSPMVAVQAIQQGQEIDFDKLKSSFSSTPGKPGISEEQKKGIKKLVRAYWDAEVKGEAEAKFQLFLAQLFYSDEIAPVVNFLNNVLPLDIGVIDEVDPRMSQSKKTILEALDIFLPIKTEGPDLSGKDWNHISDYHHQKLLMIGDSEFILGGRNVEDSYHMDINPLVSKYLFIDTEFWGLFDSKVSSALKTGALGITGSFDRLWADTSRTATFGEVRTHTDNTMVEFGVAATRACAGESDTEKKNECRKQYLLNTSPLDLSQRLVQEEALWQENLRIYKEEYASKRDKDSAKSEPDPQFPLKLSLDHSNSVRISYLENLPYENPEKKSAQQIVFSKDALNRTYDVDYKDAIASSRFIHEAWVRGLEGVCRQSIQEKSRKWVILHNAYVLLPSILKKTLSDMITGRWDCSLVDIAIITNSISTTDLNIVNPFSRMEAHAIYSVYEKQRSLKRGATLRLFDYNNPSAAAKIVGGDPGPTELGKQISLHTKVSVLGDDLIIGSANADPRSFMMDNNNAVYIRGAKELVASYTNLLVKNMNDATFSKTPDQKPSGERTQKLRELTDEYLTIVRNSDVNSNIVVQDGTQIRAGYEQIYASNLQFLNEKIIKRWKIDTKLKPETIKSIESIYTHLLDEAYTLSLMTFSKFPLAWEDREYRFQKNWIYEAIGVEPPSYYQSGLQAKDYFYRQQSAPATFDKIFQTL